MVIDNMKFTGVSVAAGSINLKDVEVLASQTFDVRGQIGRIFPLPHAA